MTMMMPEGIMAHCVHYFHDVAVEDARYTYSSVSLHSEM